MYRIPEESGVDNMNTSKWKRGALVMVLAIATFTGATAAAQDLTLGWSPRSGDVWVDTWLDDMNHYGARYPEPFIDEMVRYHNAPRGLVVDLLQTRHWAPGDVYYACSLAAVLGRPCRYVVDIYEARPRAGLGCGRAATGHQARFGGVPSPEEWFRADLRPVGASNRAR